MSSFEMGRSCARYQVEPRQMAVLRKAIQLSTPKPYHEASDDLNTLDIRTLQTENHLLPTKLVIHSQS